MGLIVDQPSSGGSGNSNDGNTARRFFQNWEQSAQILGINANVIRRCKVILETLASGMDNNYYILRICFLKITKYFQDVISTVENSGNMR